jgi:hypothetical protein
MSFMKKLILISLFLLVSCNVVQMMENGETQIPQGFGNLSQTCTNPYVCQVSFSYYTSAGFCKTGHSLDIECNADDFSWDPNTNQCYDYGPTSETSCTSTDYTPYGAANGVWNFGTKMVNFSWSPIDSDQYPNVMYYGFKFYDSTSDPTCEGTPAMSYTNLIYAHFTNFSGDSATFGLSAAMNYKYRITSCEDPNCEGTFDPIAETACFGTFNFTP